VTIHLRIFPPCFIDALLLGEPAFIGHHLVKKVFLNSLLAAHLFRGRGCRHVILKQTP